MQVRSSMNMQKPGVPSLHLWLAAQQDIHTLLTDSLYRTGSPQTEPASPRQAHRSEDYEIQDERSETRLDAAPWSQSVYAVGCPSSPRPLRDPVSSQLFQPHHLHSARSLETRPAARSRHVGSGSAVSNQRPPATLWHLTIVRNCPVSLSCPVSCRWLSLSSYLHTLPHASGRSGQAEA
ncbi:hypothetical protein CCHR01_07414 [Colletotrichum chrysophilum]|uniref:Uncharacterized protein n=1 Tax=Colletotrichum chrysophilum TaxID=1836956 RepID=A0AAD9EMH3_9PEZI|nr:hypothetical protein CCHR01_07414 [Colletotrichum chrysophilum]